MDLGVGVFLFFFFLPFLKRKGMFVFVFLKTLKISIIKKKNHAFMWLSMLLFSSLHPTKSSLLTM